MSRSSSPGEITADNIILIKNCNMSDLVKNIVLEEEPSSKENEDSINDASKPKTNFKNCNDLQIASVPSEMNESESVDNTVLNKASNSGANSTECIAVSNIAFQSENSLLNDSSNEILNNASEFENNSLSTENINEISNDVVDTGKKNFMDNNIEESNDPTDTEKNSLTDNNNEVSNNTIDTEKSSLTDSNNKESNDATETEKNSSTCSNEESNEAKNTRKNSLTDNNNEEANEAKNTKKISLTSNNNEESNDTEKISLIGNNNKESLDADSESSSNFDINTDNINVTTGITNIELSEAYKEQRERDRQAMCRTFERARNQYETVVYRCKENLEMLYKDNSDLRNEVRNLEWKLNKQEEESKKKEASIKAELLAKIEKLSRECNILCKEKEAIVIRYANSEKEVIQAKKLQQDLEKKIKDMTKDRESLLLKLKNASAENSKLTSSAENKMVEIAKLQKENEKINADCNSREIRIKWLQNKLKTEVSAHQETQGKLEHTLQRLNEMREEAEQVRRDCQEMIKCYQEAEEIKSVKLDSQLKQKLTELEVEKQEKCDQEQVYMLLRHELEALKKKQRLTMDENNTLTLKINSLEKERLEYEQTICKLKDNQNLLKEEIADMTSRLTEMEGLKLQLEQEREKSAATLREVERLRLTNAELQSDLDACHVKEGDRLDFVEKLTAKTMLLQSDHCLLEVKAQALESEVNQLKKAFTDLQQNYSDLVEDFENTKKEHESEMQLLVQKLAEKVKTVEKLNTSLEEADNENRVLKKRHIASIKELSHELYQCKKRLESYESNYGPRADCISLSSRTSSSASLHISNDMCQTSPSITYNSKKDFIPAKNDSSESQFTVDKEVLIKRIISLQKMLAKKTDKIDFLEDHIEHLVREMRKKSKSVDFKNV